MKKQSDDILEQFLADGPCVYLLSLPHDSVSVMAQNAAKAMADVCRAHRVGFRSTSDIDVILPFARQFQVHDYTPVLVFVRDGAVRRRALYQHDVQSLTAAALAAKGLLNG